MGTHTDNGECPSCYSDMWVTTDTRPFTRIYAECIHCGFLMNPQFDQMDLKWLNDCREQYNEDMELRPEDSDYLEPYDELPECTSFSQM